MRYSSVIALFLLSSQSHAAGSCRFTTECFENETCAETLFELEIRAGTGGPNELELVTDAETIAVAVGGDAKVAHFAGMTRSGFHILTLSSADGAARYTNHIGTDPLTVSYIGICELGG